MSSDPTSPKRVWPLSIRFRLIHLFYAVTLLATSLATFGAAGLLPGVILVLSWAVVFSSPARPKALFITCVVVFLGCCCLLPAIDTAHDAARRAHCYSNLRQIAVALNSYHATYGTFPPSYISDQDGKPLHSWRVLLLPFMAEQMLYDAYNFDEPWDGPSNRKLLSPRPSVYACPTEVRDSTQAGTYTSYVAVIGPSTAWPGPVGRKLSEFSDPTWDTILVVEATGCGIPWTEPRDLTFAEAIQLVTSTEPEQVCSHRYDGDFLYVQFPGRNVAMVDGRVQFMLVGVGHNVWSRMLTINDGASWSEQDVEPPIARVRKLKIGNCVRFGVWIVVVLFPLPWVWLNPRSEVRGRPSPSDRKATAAGGGHGVTS